MPREKPKQAPSTPNPLPKKWPANTIVARVLSELIPYARNARTHTEGQIKQVAESMREWGWTNPVLIDENSKIIVGHARCLAAAELGFEQVPCIVAEGWTVAQKKAYVIADNRLAEVAGWDHDLLALELTDLKAANFDLELLALDDLAALVIDAPELPDGDRPPFQQITFTLHDDQVDRVKEAIKAAIAAGSPPDTDNENKNGNALAFLCAAFMETHGKG